MKKLFDKDRVTHFTIKLNRFLDSAKIDDMTLRASIMQIVTQYYIDNNSEFLKLIISDSILKVYDNENEVLSFDLPNRTNSSIWYFDEHRISQIDRNIYLENNTIE